VPANKEHIKLGYEAAAGDLLEVSFGTLEHPALLQHRAQGLHGVRQAANSAAYRLPARLRFDCSNPAALLKTADRAIQCARTEPNAREHLDVFHDCVPVLISIG
jgi:hypothetical protein